MNETQAPPDRMRAAQAIVRQFVADEAGAISIGEAALAIATLDRPDVPLAPYRAHLEELAAETARVASPAAGLAAQAQALGRVLVDRHGYRGDARTYDDLQNANLLRVIDRRRGLPVALGILYLNTAAALGWNARGLSFPGHFLIELRAGEERAVLDPFAGLAQPSRRELAERLKAQLGESAAFDPDYLRPVRGSEVLLRLQNNIRLRLQREGQNDAALEVLERMLWLGPDRPELWYQAAVERAGLGRLSAAIAAAERCSAIAPAPIRARSADLARDLRRRLH
jgi:regulator of sirC expression with transglutaminase-like and TPR domain